MLIMLMLCTRAPPQIHFSQFSYSSSLSSGGCVSITGTRTPGRATIVSYSSFDRCSSGASGGALFASGLGSLQLLGDWFINSTASQFGGAFATGGTGVQTILDGSVLAGNVQGACPGAPAYINLAPGFTDTLNVVHPAQGTPCPVLGAAPTFAAQSDASGTCQPLPPSSPAPNATFCCDFSTTLLNCPANQVLFEQALTQARAGGREDEEGASTAAS